MINIHVRVKHLVQKYGTRDPEKLAKELGIIIKKKPYKSFHTKGFLKIQQNKKFIVVNSNLSKTIQLIVIAHELGHALLHSNSRTIYIHEYTLFPRGRVEIEANKFAAELLINEKDIDKLYIENMSIDQLSNYFGVPKQLVEYKFNKYHKYLI